MAFVEAHSSAILFIAAVLAVVLFAVAIMAKLFKLAVGVFVLSIIIPVLFTIFWGDGSAYVSEIASIFSQPHQQRIEEAYEYYKGKDAEDPIIDYDAVSNKVTDVFGNLREKGEETAKTILEDATESETGSESTQSSFQFQADIAPGS